MEGKLFFKELIRLELIKELLIACKTRAYSKIGLKHVELLGSSGLSHVD